MTNKRVHSTALLLAFARMDLDALKPKRREDDIEGVPIDELEFGPNGIERKKRQEAPE